MELIRQLLQDLWRRPPISDETLRQPSVSEQTNSFRLDSLLVFKDTAALFLDGRGDEQHCPRNGSLEAEVKLMSCCL